MTIGAPGEEAAQAGPGVLARRSGEPGQIGGDSSVELVSGRPGVSDEWGDFMLDLDPTVRSPEAGSQWRATFRPPRTRACCRSKNAGQH
jgi:hypothetical protein